MGKARAREIDDEFKAAFARLYPSAGRVALRILGDHATAEDVAAEALARTYERWPKIRTLPYLDAWVLRVTANLAIDTVRRKRPPLREPRPLWIEERIAVHVALVRAIESLSRRQRDVVVLRYIGDLSEADVSSVLGLAPGSVKTHLRRGLERLRVLLGPDFGSDLSV
jgi:RNA polymerase sigma factor (sigma-70 family)